MKLPNGLENLRGLLAASAVRNALRGSARGDLETAHKAALRVTPGDVAAGERKLVGAIFYQHGKLRAAKGHLDTATADFRKALEFDTGNQLFQLRFRTATNALHKSRRRVLSDGTTITDVGQIRRVDVISFCHEMRGKRNVSLSNLPRAAVLHYVRQAGYLYPPPVSLPELSRLDAFHALGTYRWRGDERAADKFSLWVRALKAGDTKVGRNLGHLLADWLVSDTDGIRNADYVVTVPGGPAREAQRQASPPGLLAESVQDYIGVPVLLGVLERTGSARARDLTYADMRKCFRAGKSATRVACRSVVLIDDVATRGDTLCACSEQLHNLGSEQVTCVALAQSVTTLRERRSPNL